jgi:NADH-quinone oxidoreductase subunit E
MSDLTDKVKATIDHWCAKFPSDQKRSALLMALRSVQDDQGCLTEENMQATADYLGLPVVYAHEVATFYAMYRFKKQGRFTLGICVSISCHLCGAGTLIKHLQERLGIGMGETTEDGLFTLQEAECLAACCGAPAVIVNDRDYHENMSPEKADALLEQLRKETT